MGRLATWRARIATGALGAAVVGLLVIGGSGDAPDGEAAPPPAGRSAHGAAGTARNGSGGVIAPSPTSASWPGTGAGGNGGPFAFIGAHYGPLWGIPASANNSLGVGYCIMEDVAGEGTVTKQPVPTAWDVGERARAAALMATFGGDRVVPYGIDASGGYDATSGEWQHPSLFGGGEYTRRRHVAVNFGVKMFVEDVSPTGAVSGRMLARDTAVVDGTGGEFSALRNGYTVAQLLATTAERQHAVGGVHLSMSWSTPDGAAPIAPGTYPLEVRAADATGKAVSFVPVVQLSSTGIDGHRSMNARAVVDNSSDSADDHTRWNAAAATGWPTWDLVTSMATDRRFALVDNARAADVTDVHGVAHFDVTIDAPHWELAFHTQAPTDDVAFYAGSGIQGQITWEGAPQSASVSERVGPFRIRKAVEPADIAHGRDLSGFTFTVVAVGGTSSFAETRVVTGPDGRTPPTAAPPGSYRVTEVARPAWADVLVDGGPVEFTHDPGGTTSSTEVVYRNLEPPTSMATNARDASDGDRFVMWPPDATTAEGPPVVVDTVSYRGLVPGTAYVADGELLMITDGAPPAPAGLTASTAFTPTEPSGEIEVRFELSGDIDLAGATLVAFQQVRIASSSRIVAAHEDPGAAEQTVRFPAIDTRLDVATPSERLQPAELATSATPGEALVDTVTYRGFEPGRTYRAVLTLHERDHAGRCTPTDEIAQVDFTPDSSSGTFAVDGFHAPRTGTFVAFERVFVIADGHTEQLVATHEDCDEPLQTVQVVPPPAHPPPATTTPATTSTTPAAPSTTLPTTITTIPVITTAAPPSTTVPSAPSTLPRTGGGGRGSSGALGLALLLMGTGVSLVARRPAR